MCSLKEAECKITRSYLKDDKFIEAPCRLPPVLSRPSAGNVLNVTSFSPLFHKGVKALGFFKAYFLHSKLNCGCTAFHLSFGTRWFRVFCPKEDNKGRSSSGHFHSGRYGDTYELWYMIFNQHLLKQIVMFPLINP